VTWAAQFLALLEIGGFNDAGMEALLLTGAKQGATRLGISVEELLSMPHAQEIASRVRALPTVLNTMIMSQVFVPGGGWASLANAAYQGRVGDRINMAYRSGLVAGMIVYYCATIRQFHPEMTASYNRAGHIIQFLTKQRRIHIGGDRERKKAWIEWRGVAHVWAAVFAGLDADTHQPVGHQSGLSVDVPIILGWAEWFRRFATTHKAVGAMNTLVPPHEAVVIQCGIDMIPPPLTPLPEDVRQAAFGYRAPHPAQ